MPSRLPVFILVLAFVIGLIQFGLMNIAFGRLGLSPGSAYLLLICTLAGSMINMPLFTLNADPGPPTFPPRPRQWPMFQTPSFTGKTIIAVNVGGAVVPVSFSIFLMAHSSLNLAQVVIAVAVVTFIANRFSRPLPGLGIGIPMLIAPLAAALIASVVDPQQRAPLAYIAGTLGVLIGADLLRLNDIRKLGAPLASIGGGGTFDGVFVTGLIAVLLA